MKPLDLTVLPGVESAVSSAARLTAAGHHEEARDDLRRAFLLAGEQLGLPQKALSFMVDSVLDVRGSASLLAAIESAPTDDTDPRYYSRGRELPRVGT